MRSFWRACAVLGLVVPAPWAACASGPHSVGVGMHYWVATNDIESDDFREDSYAPILSYQYTPGILSLEFDVEYFPERYAGFDDRAFAPQAYVLLGTLLYGGMGYGSFYTDGDFRDEFFVLRLGFDLAMSSRWSLDFNGNYHWTDFDNIRDIDEELGGDSITLGVMLRYRF